MSVTADYSFNSDPTPKELAEQLSRLIGCALVRDEQGGPGEVFAGTLFGMELTLWDDHFLDSDRDLNFEDLRYQLSTKTRWEAAHLRRFQVEVTAFAAFVLHRELAVDRGMLTFDLQAVLARCESDRTLWRDAADGSEVRFPEHFLAIRARVPRSSS